MHRNTCFVASLAALLMAGCIKKSNDDDTPKGTTKSQAAEALTKAMSFEGGERVDGLIPEADNSDVMLFPVDAGEVIPGAASLMAMDVSPTDATATAALIQFQDADSSHFLIDSASFVSTEAGRIELKYSIEANVCDDLCATVYELDVIEALDLGKDGVTEHKTTTLKLDCSKRGKASLCGEENKIVEPTDDMKTDAGTPADAGAGADACVDESCDPTVTVIACGDGFTTVTGAQLCDGVADCPGQNPIDESASACTHCADSVDAIYSIDMRCDGKDDCADGSDEQQCQRMCADGGAPFDLKALCDGTDDCADTTDEKDCTGLMGQFSCGDDSFVPVEFVCNGVEECSTAADEAGCASAPGGFGMPADAGSR